MATTVPMLAPDGSTGDIPADRVRDAVGAGFKKAIPMTSPDGKTGYIPEDRAPDALKSGFKLTLQPGVKQVGTNPAGQPIYGPAGTEPEGSAVGRFLSSAGTAIGDTAKGIYHALADSPQNLQEQAIDAHPIVGPINLRIQRMVTGPAADQAQQAIAAAHAGSPSLAIGHGLAAALPMVGPAAAQVGQQVGEQAGLGNYAGAAGTLAGNAAMGEATRLAPKLLPGMTSSAGRVALLGKTPEAAYETALKVPPSISAVDRARMVQAGLQNAIPVSPGGLEKLGSLIDDLNTKIKDTINSDPNRPIDPNAVAARLADTSQRFANQVVAEPDLAAIEAQKAQFLKERGAQPGTPGKAPQPTGMLDARGNPIMDTGTPPTPPQLAPAMGAADAQAMKTGTYGILRGKYGEQGSAVVESQKALARGLKEEIATQFPEISNLNATESRLLDLGPQLERAVNRIGNHASPIGIGGPLLASGVKAATGSTGAAAALGVMRSVFSVPEIQSRVAIAVSKGAKIPFPQALERVRAYSASLAAASPSGTQDQSATSQPQQ